MSGPTQGWRRELLDAAILPVIEPTSRPNRQDVVRIVNQVSARFSWNSQNAETTIGRVTAPTRAPVRLPELFGDLTFAMRWLLSITPGLPTCHSGLEQSAP